MKQLLLAPVFVLIACGLAGLYGVIHNQISYTVGPGYFHEFKFIQFAIPSEIQNRWGAGTVGWLASWWMGIYIGLPLSFMAIFMKRNGTAFGTFFRTALLVISVTLGTGIIALIVSLFTIDADNLPIWMDRFDVSDPVAFARAGTMHNFAYLGGLIGMITGIVYLILHWRRHQS